MSFTTFLIGYIICGLMLFVTIMAICRFTTDEKITALDVEKAIWSYGVCWPIGLVYFIYVLITAAFKKITSGKMDAFVKFMNKGK